MEKYDFIIVGSGLYGATFNYLARKEGFSTLIVERREHLGGNIFTPVMDDIPIHKYGAHIFHTNEKYIWDFVCGLCDMVPFINSPIAIYHDEVYNLPFNMNTFSKLFGVIKPSDVREKINEEINNFNFTNPVNLEEQAISLVGETIYRKLIKEYTEKQWGKECKELSPDIIKRIPVRYTYDNNYFNDIYQGIPKGGFNSLIENLIGDTKVIYTDYLKNKDYFNSIGKYIIYTGPIDEYFDFSEGNLEWRSLDFVTKKYNVQNYQGNAVINYTSHDVPYTRSIEHKFFDKFGDGVNKEVTYVTEEYPIEWKRGAEPLYPVLTKNNLEVLEKYNLLKKKELNVLFCGRLGEYKYYDMDDTIINAINCFNNLIKK